MTNTTISFKRPNNRHFYSYYYRGEPQSGLKLNSVKFQNTVIRPGIDVTSDVQTIESGTAQYRELCYLSVHRLSALNIRLSIALAIVLTLAEYFPGSKPSYDPISAFFIYLIVSGIAMFGINWLFKLSYRFVGENRVEARSFTFNITLFLTGLTMLFSYMTLSGVSKLNILWQITNLFFALYVAPTIVSRLACLNLRANKQIKIEHEWQVQGRTYGVHVNQKDQLVLYPKSGEGFYPMNAFEYKKLIAYQTTQGNRVKAEELFKIWRSKPLEDEYQEKLTRLQQFNPLRQLANLLLNVSAPLLGPFLEKAGQSCGLKTLEKFGVWCQRQGFDRVFLIYQDCESALTESQKTVAMGEVDTFDSTPFPG
jgi:hypothetical protein